MKSESQDSLRKAINRTERAVPTEVRAIRESINTARQGNEELLLAELRMQRDRLKRLIRLLSEEAPPEEGTAVAGGPLRPFRHRCQARPSRAD